VLLYIRICQGYNPAFLSQINRFDRVSVPGACSRTNFYEDDCTIIKSDNINITIQNACTLIDNFVPTLAKETGSFLFTL
jgi:hypothetical protein